MTNRIGQVPLHSHLPVNMGQIELRKLVKEAILNHGTVQKAFHTGYFSKHYSSLSKLSDDMRLLGISAVQIKRDIKIEKELTD